MRPPLPSRPSIGSFCISLNGPPIPFFPFPFAFELFAKHSQGRSTININAKQEASFVQKKNNRPVGGFSHKIKCRTRGQKLVIDTPRAVDHVMHTPVKSLASSTASGVRVPKAPLVDDNLSRGCTAFGTASTVQ